jgi:CTP synthase
VTPPSRSTYVDAEQIAANAAPRTRSRRSMGCWCLEGFGERGSEGKIAAIRYARERGIPFFGICLGMQMAVCEYARGVAGIRERPQREFDPNLEAR